MAVSPKPWALTILPPRKVNTSTWGADSPPAVTWVKTTTISSSARKRLGVVVKGLLRQLREPFRDLGFAAIRSADRAVTGHDPLDVVVEDAQDRFDVARGERGVPLLGCLDILALDIDQSPRSVFRRRGFSPTVLPCRRQRLDASGSSGRIVAETSIIDLDVPCMRNVTVDDDAALDPLSSSDGTSHPSASRLSRRSSRSSSTWRLDGSTPCSRIDHRTAARSRSSASMISRSRTHQA